CASHSVDLYAHVSFSSYCYFFFFFFSSRRRHTRSYGDWSSDVCSSDLPCPCCGTTTEGKRYEQQQGHGDVVGIPGSSVRVAIQRSEERRVGKECRSRGSA